VEFSLRAIGHVESPLKRRGDAPKQGEEGSPPAVIVFDVSVREGLRDMKIGDRLLLLTWLNRADRNKLSVHPRGNRTIRRHGVFSTRSPDRPNPIGLHRITVVSILDSLRFGVRDLEVLNLTPILDVKPVLAGMAGS